MLLLLRLLMSFFLCRHQTGYRILRICALFTYIILLPYRILLTSSLSSLICLLHYFFFIAWLFLSLWLCVQTQKKKKIAAQIMNLCSKYACLLFVHPVKWDWEIECCWMDFARHQQNIERIKNEIEIIREPLSVQFKWFNVCKKIS